jgi:hypothetical protein
MRIEDRIFRVLIGTLALMVLLAFAVGALFNTAGTLQDNQHEIKVDQARQLEGQELAKQRGYDARVAPCIVLLMPPNDEPNPRTAIARNPPAYCTIEPVLQRINQAYAEAGLPPLRIEPTPEPG